MGRIDLAPDYCFNNAKILLQGKDVLVTYKNGHYHTFYEFFLVEQGDALHTVNGHAFVVEKGDMVLIRPNDVHVFNAYETCDYHMINVPISAADFDMLAAFLGVEVSCLLQGDVPPCVHLDHGKLDTISGRLRAIRNMPVSPLRGAHMRFAAIEVLLELLGAEQTANELPDWLGELLRRLEESMETPSQFDAILAGCGKSKEHICRMFRRYLDMTPTQYCVILRIRRAGELLRTTDMPIKEVCRAVGFERQNYFYRRFAEYYHMTPLEYRRNAEETHATQAQGGETDV